MPKLKGSALAKAVLRRVVDPAHLLNAGKLQFRRRPQSSGRTRDDEQLKLFADLLPGDFLHYGYFDDPTRPPQDISFSALTRAQMRYAELVLEQIDAALAPAPGATVLDVGCGMGGMCGLLLNRGMTPVALTPNDTQASYVRAKYPSVEVLHCKFEDMPAADASQTHRFDAVITAESLQYLKLPRALPKLKQVPSRRAVGRVRLLPDCECNL
jgi:2-polyprenyl-3-methyl-5-hydroxy-6-metoxy-1,4-benzoquinol methylase